MSEPLVEVVDYAHRLAPALPPDAPNLLRMVLMGISDEPIPRFEGRAVEELLTEMGAVGFVVTRSEPRDEGRRIVCSKGELGYVLYTYKCPHERVVVGKAKPERKGE